MFLGELLVVSVMETPKLFVPGEVIEMWPSGVLLRPPYINKGSKFIFCLFIASLYYALLSVGLVARNWRFPGGCRTVYVQYVCRPTYSASERRFNCRPSAALRPLCVVEVIAITSTFKVSFSMKAVGVGL